MLKNIVGIIGGHSHNTNPQALEMATAVGAELGKRGFAIVCGGYDGVMEAACRGCKQAGGTTIGILKGNSRTGVNPHVDYAIVTSMDVASNSIIVWTAQSLVAFDGRYGTLNEMALALDFGKPLVTVGAHTLLRVQGIDTERFAHYEGYEPARVPEIIDRLEYMMRGVAHE
jgi:uncharacterized protein (TIGR00725 family)